MSTPLSNKRELYIKLRADSRRDDGSACYHIHVDARQALPASCIRQLLDAGFFFDFFDHAYRVGGLGGDPNVPFPSYAPLVHFTFVTSSAREYRSQWRTVHRIVSESKTPCYLEGELITLDEPLTAKLFDVDAYKSVAPALDAHSETPFRFLSAIDGTTRSLPALIKLRRLDPDRNGPRDRFRVGEVHLTVRHDTHPKLLELLCNLGFSVPAIPKLVEGDDGTLEVDARGELKVIHDIPLTLQGMSMSDVVLATNLAVTIIDRVGGLQDGSVKLEHAINFELFNGVDYSEGVPPVICEIGLRPDFRSIDANHIGNRAVLTSGLAKQAARTGRDTTPPRKNQVFDRIWAETDRKYRGVKSTGSPSRSSGA